ncbi:hypothetical protein H4R35_002829 [Dimargaris xerosporica]|nr:hypothetical protein H4R35_002829 [Dimargaris xerosporica]
MQMANQPPRFHYEPGAANGPQPHARLLSGRSIYTTGVVPAQALNVAANHYQQQCFEQNQNAKRLRIEANSDQSSPSQGLTIINYGTVNVNQGLPATSPEAATPATTPTAAATPAPPSTPCQVSASSASASAAPVAYSTVAGNTTSSAANNDCTPTAPTWPKLDERMLDPKRLSALGVTSEEAFALQLVYGPQSTLSSQNYSQLALFLNNRLVEYHRKIARALQAPGASPSRVPPPDFLLPSLSALEMLHSKVARGDAATPETVNR